MAFCGKVRAGQVGNAHQHLGHRWQVMGEVWHAYGNSCKKKKRLTTESLEHARTEALHLLLMVVDYGLATLTYKISTYQSFHKSHYLKY